MPPHLALAFFNFLFFFFHLFSHSPYTPIAHLPPPGSSTALPHIPILFSTEKEVEHEPQFQPALVH